MVEALRATTLIEYLRVTNVHGQINTVVVDGLEHEEHLYVFFLFHIKVYTPRAIFVKCYSREWL